MGLVIIKKNRINSSFAVLRSNEVCKSRPLINNMAASESVTLAACTRVKKSGNLKSPMAPLNPKKTPAISRMLLTMSNKSMSYRYEYDVLINWRGVFKKSKHRNHSYEIYKSVNNGNIKKIRPPH